MASASALLEIEVALQKTLGAQGEPRKILLISWHRLRAPARFYPAPPSAMSDPFGF
jgi:hypothetical protein